MNKLPLWKRAQILHMLVEGSSMRSTSRVMGVSIYTVARLLREAGEACREYHDDTVIDVNTRYVQCDELWSFCYAKQGNVADAKSPPPEAGDIWTWMALADESRLVLSWLVSTGRSSDYAIEFMDDVRERLASRVQLSTDGLRSYVEAVEGAFGGDVDYAQAMKVFGRGEQAGKVVRSIKVPIVGDPDLRYADTAHVERHNLTTRQSVKRLARATNAHSKKIERHRDAVALYSTWYNFCRVHSTLRQTPAQAAGLARWSRDLDWIVELIDARRPQPSKRGPYKTR